jgi:hypothetical protein
VLIHIGYHKTGSTWLQTRLFVTAPLARPWSGREVVDDFVLVNAFAFDARAVSAKY